MFEKKPLVAALFLSLVGCGKEPPRPPLIDPSAVPLELVNEPEGAKFLAAVEFERLGKTPFEDVRTERAVAGDLPAELRPIRVIAGQWDLKNNVRVEGSLYLAASTDTRWIGVLVTDSSGKTRWFTEFVLKDGKIFEGGTAELIGEEKDAAKVLSTYLKKTPISSIP